MGKRKERRLAAKTAVNRRVKLDLLAEPSGDFGDSSTKEVGGEGNTTNQAGSPNSPSSSGQRPENPLLLLGQYSDEEVEEESVKESSRDAGENSPAEHDDQVKGDSCEGAGADEDEDLTAQKVDQEVVDQSPSLDALQMVVENGAREDDTAHSPHKDTDAVEQTTLPEQTTGEVDSGWKMVFHEESNSYYYWNIVTGETSWEVPVILVQGTQSAIDPKPAPELEGHTTFVDTHIPNANLDAAMDPSASTQPSNGEINASRGELDVQNEGYIDIMANDGEKDNQIKITEATGPVGLDYCSSQEKLASYGQSNDAFLSNGEVQHSDYWIQDTRGHINQEAVGDLSSDSSRLLQLGEYLLERLKSLGRSEECNEQISKLIFELDIRLADIKSLVPYGSSLLPFWLHSENQLKKLEAAINNENLRCSDSKKGGKEENSHEANADNRSPVSPSLDSHVSKEAKEISNCIVHHENATSVGNPGFSDSNVQGDGDMVEACGNASQADAVQNTSLHSDQDVDMDVEMEVEDTAPFSDAHVEDESLVQKWAQPGQSIPQIPNPQPNSLQPEEGFEVPPPPNDEWIPPPPPDEEPLPPLPPDEPLDASFPQPPSEIQTAQPYSYADQYDLTYPSSSFDYYGQTNTEVPSNGYYVDANGCQVAAPISNLYYTAVPNLYPEAASVVNSGDPVAYYSLPEGSVSTAPGHDQTGSTVTPKEVGFTVLSSSQVDVSSAEKEIQKPSTEISSVLASTYSSTTTTTVTSCVSVVSAPAVAATVALTESVCKAQPKVTRHKKRTVATMPTLRSKKKVSGLVDKWKAVKEEMQEEEEDEPENAYELLEKKRQREIEQWHAQQIASGEAKDNANFQPLGGDWRERVRRKRAKKSKEEEQNPTEDDVVGDQQPDLNELTKQLPSGWQAYWDEGSKKVYYGNKATSETTWIKPTN